jgi:hypothetical protein
MCFSKRSNDSTINIGIPTIATPQKMRKISLMLKILYFLRILILEILIKKFTLSEYIVKSPVYGS